jgi:hypothetical protein
MKNPSLFYMSYSCRFILISDSKIEMIRIKSLHLWVLMRIFIHSLIGDSYYRWAPVCDHPRNVWEDSEGTRPFFCSLLFPRHYQARNTRRADTGSRWSNGSSSSTIPSIES